MKAIVSGAGGSSVLMHLHNASKALGLHGLHHNAIDMSHHVKRMEHNKLAMSIDKAMMTTITTNTKKLRKEVVDSAKAFVPVDRDWCC